MRCPEASGGSNETARFHQGGRQRGSDVAFAARAQQREPLRRVAFLDPLAKDTPGAQERYTAFLEAFEQLGWTPGRNVRLEARWGGGDEAAIRKHAAELVALAPDVILAGGGTVVEVMESYSHRSLSSLSSSPTP